MMHSSSTGPGLLCALFFQRLLQQGEHGLIFVATGGPFGVNQLFKRLHAQFQIIKLKQNRAGY